MGVCEEEESVIERTEEIELELGLGFDPDHPLPSDDHPLPFDDEDVEIVNEECKNLGLEEDENLNQEKEEESVAKEEIKTKFYHPKRPGEPDCSYYLRTGTCRYGPNCRFNHPLRGKNTGRSSNSSDSSESAQVLKEEKEDFPERAGQPECKVKYEVCHICELPQDSRHSVWQSRDVELKNSELVIKSNTPYEICDEVALSETNLLNQIPCLGLDEICVFITYSPLENPYEITELCIGLLKHVSLK